MLITNLPHTPRRWYVCVDTGQTVWTLDREGRCMWCGEQVDAKDWFWERHPEHPLSTQRRLWDAR